MLGKYHTLGLLPSVLDNTPLLAQSGFHFRLEISDSQRLQSEAPRHIDAVLPYNYPHGDLLAAVKCQLDTQTHRITPADLASGPPIARKAVQTCTARACAYRMPSRNERATRRRLALVRWYLMSPKIELVTATRLAK